MAERVSQVTYDLDRPCRNRSLRSERARVSDTDMSEKTACGPSGRRAARRWHGRITHEQSASVF